MSKVKEHLYSIAAIAMIAALLLVMAPARAARALANSSATDGPTKACTADGASRVLVLSTPVRVIASAKSIHSPSFSPKAAAGPVVSKTARSARVRMSWELWKCVRVRARVISIGVSRSTHRHRMMGRRF